MLEEQQLIEKMLKEKKITEPEAAELLKALKKSYGLDDDREEQVERKKTATLEIDRVQLGEKISSLISNFMKTNEDTAEEYRGQFENDQPEIKLNNINGQIKLSCWDQDFFKLKVKYNHNNARLPGKINRRPNIVSVHQDTTGLEVLTKKRYGDGLSSNLILYLPSNTGYKLDISNFNGNIELADIKITKGVLQLNNGNIKANNYQAKELDLSLVNGNVYLQGLANMLGVDIKNGNGEIAIPEGTPCFLEGSSKMGELIFALDRLTYLKKDVKMFKKHLIASTADWANSENKSKVKVTTKNGNIKIGYC